MHKLTKDISGNKYGRLSVISFQGYKQIPSGGKKPMWNCVCDCGKECVADGTLMRSGTTTSCGCYRRELKYKHGMSLTKEHDTWLNIKDRCLNEKCKSYPEYGGAGLKISEEFINDFMAFYSEIGPVPDDGKQYSIDRIDNSLGYLIGNIRWATDQEQNCNKSKMRTNTTGYTGVRLSDGKYVADCRIYSEKHGKVIRKCKYFSISKYGKELAFELACRARDDLLVLARESGVPYSEGHGK